MGGVCSIATQTTPKPLSGVQETKFCPKKNQSKEMLKPKQEKAKRTVVRNVKIALEN